MSSKAGRHAARRAPARGRRARLAVTVATFAGGLVAVVAAFAGGLVAGQSAATPPSDALSNVSRTGLASPGYPDKVAGGRPAAASSQSAKPASKPRTQRPVTRHHATRPGVRPVVRHTATGSGEHHVARHAGTWFGQHPATRHTIRRAASRTGQHATLTAVHCSGSSIFLPENYVTIVSFLIHHGYSKLGAAGIAGNMWQESKGNPESVGSGGGGLIGFTPLPAGYVTGNPTADLKFQLNAVLTYNQQWAQFIPALNAATSATQAADIYMNDFERPGIPVQSNREAAAAAVASACGF